MVGWVRAEARGRERGCKTEEAQSERWKQEDGK
jgi:hypothetical protein